MHSVLGRERNGDLNPVPPLLPKRNNSNMPWLFCPLPPNVSFFFFFLIFLLQSLTVLITFLPLWESLVLLPFSLQSPSLCQIDTRSPSKSLSSHSLFVLGLFFFQLFPIFPVWTSFFPWPPFNSCLLSWVSHLSVSLIFLFLPVSGMSLSLISPPSPSLISREICLLIARLFPHPSGIQPLHSASPPPPPIFIYASVPPRMCKSSAGYANQQEFSWGFCPDFRHASELMTWVKESALTLNFLAFDFSFHSLTFL